MRLVSLVSQDVHLPADDLRVRLDAGEAIWTESSYKYEPDGIRALVAPAGFIERAQWLDEQSRFALTLFETAAAG